MKSLADRVGAFVLGRNMLEGISRLGLAVSGGADSIALLELLAPLCKRKGVGVFAINIDHGRDGEETAAQFVRDRAKLHDIHFIQARGTLQVREGNSVETAARELRMRLVLQLSREHSIDAIATGHHADDVAETLLLKLARGSGIDGLCGLRPVSFDGTLHFIRPLLETTHKELCDYLAAQKIPWYEDPDNEDLSSPRNRIRRLVLPFLEREFNKDVRKNLLASAELLREDDAALRGLLPPPGKSFPKIVGLPVALQRRAVREWLFANDRGSEATRGRIGEFIRRNCDFEI